MSTRFKIVTAGVLLAAAAFIALRIFKFEPGRDRADAAFHPSVGHKAGERLDEQSRGRESSAPPGRSALADALNSPNTDIRADLKLVLELIDTYRSNFLQTGNPVGSNAEITAALTGRNKLRLSLIPVDHPAINQEGELCDRWGTPFFFHAQSAARMEIRSAGPDKRMWSGDDVILSP